MWWVKHLGHDFDVRERTIHTTVNRKPKATHPRMTRLKRPAHVTPNWCSPFRIKNERSPRARCSAVVMSTGVESTSAESDRRTANQSVVKRTAKMATVI